MIKETFKVNEMVYDDLTRHTCKIIGINYALGRVWDGGRQVTYHGVVCGIWLDDPYLDGGRHPWEVTKLRDVNQLTLNLEGVDHEVP